MKKSQFQFSNPELINVVFNINENFDEKGAEIFSDIITKTDMKRKEDASKAYVRLSVSISKESNLPFYFDISMGTEVIWEKDCNEIFVDAILQNNVPALLLSYIRPIVSILTSNTGYPAFNIPFLDFRNADEVNE